MNSSDRDQETMRRWVKFFGDAGLPTGVATSYALLFHEQRIKITMLNDLTKEILQEIGIKVMGDIIAILKHARIVNEQISKNKLLGPSLAISSDDESSPSLKMSSVPNRPSVVTVKRSDVKSRLFTQPSDARPKPELIKNVPVGVSSVKPVQAKPPVTNSSEATGAHEQIIRAMRKRRFEESEPSAAVAAKRTTVVASSSLGSVSVKNRIEPKPTVRKTVVERPPVEAKPQANTIFNRLGPATTATQPKSLADRLGPAVSTSTRLVQRPPATAKSNGLTRKVSNNLSSVNVPVSQLTRTTTIRGVQPERTSAVRRLGAKVVTKQVARSAPLVANKMTVHVTNDRVRARVGGAVIEPQKRLSMIADRKGPNGNTVFSRLGAK